MPRRGSERAIARHQPRIQRLGESDVDGVVGSQIVTQFPRAAEQVDVRVAKDGQHPKVLDRLFGPVEAHLTGANEAAECLDDFYVEQMGSMQVVAVAEQPRLDADTKGRLQEELRHRRRIDDDQSVPRSRRITAAAEPFSLTRERL